MVKVALVDDHQLFRKSLSLLLGSIDGVSVDYDTHDGLAFLKYLEDYEIDVLLLDLEMPLVHGFDVCKQAKLMVPSLRVIILSQLTSKEAVHKVMEIGANGYFTKNSSPEMLENAIRNVMDRDYYFDMALSSVIREAMLWKKKRTVFSDTPTVYLTPKEIEIVKLATQEKCSKEIAAVLNISTRTVEKHRNHIMEKTESKNFIGVVLFALKNQIIELEDI
ncbi:response regulator transcription factor [Flavobacterium sp.]|uniref:response regulator transcription factor n=1 Tax=Flavobacterium sp. TaxID=239 RepID=UPI00262855F2|nr:response regulator transcription factor [Flavobacterium sp.]